MKEAMRFIFSTTPLARSRYPAVLLFSPHPHPTPAQTQHPQCPSRRFLPHCWGWGWGRDARRQLVRQCESGL